MNVDSALQDILATPKNIVITSHQKPDGDALGSSLALYGFLTAHHHKVDVIFPTDFPDYYNWMPYIDITQIANKSEAQRASFINADLIFCLDFNSIDRVEEVKEQINSSKAVKVMLDHHLKPENFCDYNFSSPKSSSTSEMVYDFIIALDKDYLLTREVAECIYTGILTDTGGFQFSCTSNATHLVASKLLEAGIQPDIIFNNCYNNFSLDRLKLFGFCLDKKMTLVGKNAAYICIGPEEKKKFNIQEGDTEGLVNFPLKIDNIGISVLFKQDEGKIKISFRSKHQIDVSAIAREHFHGGGHRNASGGTSYESMEKTVEKFEKIILELIH
mgnify:CR=1 FL=1